MDLALVQEFQLEGGSCQGAANPQQPIRSSESREASRDSDATPQRFVQNAQDRGKWLGNKREVVHSGKPQPIRRTTAYRCKMSE